MRRFKVYVRINGYLELIKSFSDHLALMVYLAKTKLIARDGRIRRKAYRYFIENKDMPNELFHIHEFLGVYHAN